jgi:hypothetical protein
MRMPDQALPLGASLPSACPPGTNIVDDVLFEQEMNGKFEVFNLKW